jgi:uncharacterized protein
MKRAFIIHGWEGVPNEGWKPWLRGELEKKGFSVKVPAMPSTNNPKVDAWVSHLAKVVGKPDKDCYFIGHSLGCITIIRYLEKLKGNIKVGGAVFVSGFASNLGFEQIGSFFKAPINWRKVKSRCKRFVAIHSDNDRYVSLHYGSMFKRELGAELVVKHNMKHFAGSDGITEVPVVRDAVLRISGKRS